MSSKPRTPLFVERGEISLRITEKFAGRGQKKAVPMLGQPPDFIADYV